jgi:hypothetical protein
LLFAIALAATVVQADETTKVIPTEDCRGYWFIPVTLNEEKFGPGKILNFIYDTGASSTLIDAAALERVSGKSFDEGDRVRLVNATAGDVTFRKLPAKVDNLGHLSMAMGRGVDGILAVDVFKQFLLTLDPTTWSMSLAKGKLPKPDNETIFSTRGPDKRPWLKVAVGGINTRLLVDSGAASTGVAIKSIERYPLRGEPRVLSSSVRLNRIENRRLARLDGPVELAGITFVNPVMEEVPGTQLLGGKLLRHFVMTLDQGNRRLELQGTGQTEIPPEPHFELGMAYRPNSRGLEVRDVYADTPSAEAGILVGDIVVAINGKRPDQRGCSALREQNSEVVLAIERGEMLLEKTLLMKPVIPAN